MGIFRNRRSKSEDNDAVKTDKKFSTIRTERMKTRLEGRKAIVEARATVAKERKWSFISLAVIAVVIAAMYFSGGLTSLVPMITDFVKNIK
jgi:hypothetical protein